jgi:hypothetical protein
MNFEAYNQSIIEEPNSKKKEKIDYEEVIKILFEKLLSLIIVFINKLVLSLIIIYYYKNLDKTSLILLLT